MTTVTRKAPAAHLRLGIGGEMCLGLYIFLYYVFPYVHVAETRTLKQHRHNDNLYYPLALPTRRRPVSRERAPAHVGEIRFPPCRRHSQPRCALFRGWSVDLTAAPVFRVPYPPTGAPERLLLARPPRLTSARLRAPPSRTPPPPGSVACGILSPLLDTRCKPPIRRRGGYEQHRAVSRSRRPGERYLCVSVCARARDRSTPARRLFALVARVLRAQRTDNFVRGNTASRTDADRLVSGRFRGERHAFYFSPSRPSYP